MLVKGQGILGIYVFAVVLAEPVWKRLYDLGNRFPGVLSCKGGTAAARIVGEGAIEALVQRPRKKRGLAKAGMSRYTDARGIQFWQGLGIIHDRHSRPRPKADLAAIVGIALTFGIDPPRQAVGKIPIIAGHVLVAEGQGGKALVHQLLGGLIAVGNIVAEIDVNKARNFGLSLRGYVIDRKRELPPLRPAGQLQGAQRGFPCTEFAVKRDLLCRHLVGACGQIAVFLTQKQIQKFFLFKSHRIGKLPQKLH